MKTKYLFLFCFFLLVQGKAQTPDWIWAKISQSATLSASSEEVSIAVDKLDNIYVAGYFSGIITFGAYSVSDSDGAFLAKYDSNGNVVWVRGSTGRVAVGWSIITDDIGNIYMAGTFSDTVQFGAYSLISAGGDDVFVVKYDPVGNVQWAKRGGGAGTDLLSAMTQMSCLQFLLLINIYN